LTIINLELEIEAIFSKNLNYHDFDTAIAFIQKLITEDNQLEIFKILWNKSISAQYQNKYVYLSALTLYKSNMNCPLSLKSSIHQIIESEWDISIEEVPWYLVNQFSKEAIIALLKEIDFKTQDQKIKLQTIAYWVKLSK